MVTKLKKFNDVGPGKRAPDSMLVFEEGNPGHCKLNQGLELGCPEVSAKQSIQFPTHNISPSLTHLKLQVSQAKTPEEPHSSYGLAGYNKKPLCIYLYVVMLVVSFYICKLLMSKLNKPGELRTHLRFLVSFSKLFP